MTAPRRTSAVGWFIRAALLLGLLLIAGYGYLLWRAGQGERPFSIPSASMEPTLKRGDYLWTGPIGDPSALRRGDVVVFTSPAEPEIFFVKRLIGLPGDRVQMIRGALHLNGAPAPRRPIDDYRWPIDQAQSPRPCPRREPDACLVPRFVETLPNGASYQILDGAPASTGDDTPLFIVPSGHVFLLGDNRDNALDSRFPAIRGGYGFVPLSNLRHKNGRVLFSMSGRDDRFGVDIAPDFRSKPTE